MTFGASSGSGILWIDAISDNLTEGPEFAFFEIVEDDSYEIMSVSQNDYVSVGEYSYTRTCGYVGNIVSVSPSNVEEDGSNAEWTSADFLLRYLSFSGESTDENGWIGSVDLATVNLDDDYRRAEPIVAAVNQHRQEVRDIVLEDFINNVSPSSYETHKPYDLQNVDGLFVLGNGQNTGVTQTSITFCSTPDASLTAGYTEDPNQPGVFHQNNPYVTSEIRFYTVVSVHTFSCGDAFVDPTSTAWLTSNFSEEIQSAAEPFHLIMELMATPTIGEAYQLRMIELIGMFSLIGDNVADGGLTGGLTGNQCAAICARLLDKAQQNDTNIYPYGLNTQWNVTDTYTIQETITYSGNMYFPPI